MVINNTTVLASNGAFSSEYMWVSDNPWGLSPVATLLIFVPMLLVSVAIAVFLKIKVDNTKWSPKLLAGIFFSAIFFTFSTYMILTVHQTKTHDINDAKQWSHDRYGVSLSDDDATFILDSSIPSTKAWVEGDIVVNKQLISVVRTPEGVLLFDGGKELPAKNK